MNENALTQDVILAAYRWTIAKLVHEAAMLPDTAMNFAEANQDLRAALRAYAGGINGTD